MVFTETAEKLLRRKEALRCMECSALAALRSVTVANFSYAADHLSEEKWDMNLSNHADLENG